MDVTVTWLCPYCSKFFSKEVMRNLHVGRDHKPVGARFGFEPEVVATAGSTTDVREMIQKDIRAALAAKGYHGKIKWKFTRIQTEPYEIIALEGVGVI